MEKPPNTDHGKEGKLKNDPDKSSTATLPPVDGRHAWTIVLATFCIQVFVSGTLFTYGILLPPLLQSFKGSTFTQIAAVGTIQLALFYGGGLFAGPLSDRYGARIICATGGLLWFIGIFTSTYAVDYGVFLFTYGILTGIGASFCYWSTLAVIPQWFSSEKRALGTVVALIGGGIGQIVYSLALGSYFGQDWRYMCRVSSGVGFVVILLGSLTMKRRSPIQSKKEIGNNIHLLVKDRNYRLFVLVCFVLQFGAFVPFVHLVTYMLMQGLTSGQAYNVMGLLSGASVIGRILFGTGSKRFGGLWMLRVALLICVLSLYLWLTCTTYESLLCFAFFFGLAYGGTLSLLTLICVEYWGNEKVGAALSVILLSMVPGAACSGIIAGAIRDKTGSYEGAIIAAGTFYLVAFLLSLIVTQPTKQSTVESVPEKEQEVEMI